MLFAVFTGESLYGFHRFFHQPLRAGNLFLKTLCRRGRPLFQRQQPDIDSQQSLGDFILQLVADLLSLALLRRQNPMGQALQMFLQATGFLQ